MEEMRKGAFAPVNHLGCTLYRKQSKFTHRILKKVVTNPKTNVVQRDPFFPSRYSLDECHRNPTAAAVYGIGGLHPELPMNLDFTVEQKSDLEFHYPFQRNGVTPPMNLIYSISFPQGRNRRWFPKAEFVHWSLLSLANEFPRDDSACGFTFILEMQGIGFDEAVLFGDESGFRILKTRFLQKIKGFLANYGDLNIIEITVGLLTHSARQTFGI